MPLRRPALAAGLGLCAFLIYNANGREIGSYDSQPAKFLAIELATHHTLSLDAVVRRLPPLAERPGFRRDRSGTYRSAYPLPSAFAAALVAWTLSHAHVLDLDGPLAPNLVAKLTASALTSLAVALAFVIARTRTSPWRACLIAVAFGFGTNLWGGVSQTLWQQETSIAAVTAAVALLTAVSATPMRSLALGALLGYAGWARPQIAPIVAGLLMIAVMRWRGRAAWAAAATACVATIAMTINVRWFGHVLGAAPALEALHPAVHGVSGSLGAHPLEAALGLLVGPSRGLLVFSPIVWVPLAGLRRSDAVWDRFDRQLAAVAGVQFLAYASYSVWWAGHTFGPRYLLDVLPLLIPAAAGVDWTSARLPTRVAAAVCLAWSIGVAGLGAFVYPAERWNTSPLEVDRHHGRLWDWRDSQIARALATGPSPQNFDFFR